MKNIIEKIHYEFDSAQDRLLKEAQLILSSQNSSTIDVSERLKSIGFINTPTAKKGSEFKNSLVKSKQEAELIEYYSTAYPFLKFLTEKELNRICQKYNLVHNPVENYIGEVPYKNLIDIENAQSRRKEDNPDNLIFCELKRDDSFMLFPDGNWTGIWGTQWYRIPNRIDGHHFNTQWKANDFLRENYRFRASYLVSEITNCEENRQGLFICAPKSQFKGKNKTISIINIVPKDPIVFRYVRGGVQVLTKWGLEADDKSLIVPILN